LFNLGIGDGELNTAQSAPHSDLLPRVLAPYGVDAKSVSAQHDFVNHHIATLETSANETIARTGFVLKRASEGFGIGYKVPLAVIAMGQAMLGIDLAVATPFMASNPAAFTAAAMGAVFWGYQSLDSEQKATLHTMIGEAFDFGVELVKTIVEFCIRTLTSILNSDELAELKRYVAEFAEALGSSLYEVTGRIYDRVTEIAGTAGAAITSAGSAVSSSASTTFSKGKSLIWKNKDGNP